MKKQSAEGRGQSEKRYLAEKRLLENGFEAKTKQGVINEFTRVINELDLPDTFVNGKFNFRGVITLSITTIDRGKTPVD